MDPGPGFERPDVRVRPGLLARNVAWLTSGEVLSRLIAFVIAVYLARVLGAEGYGKIGAALALATYIAIVVNAGLDPFTTREVARWPARLPSFLAQVLTLRLVLATAMYALLAALVLLLPDRAVGGRALALVYGGILFTTATRADWALRGRDEMRPVAVGMVLQHVLYAAGIFLLVRGPSPALVLVPLAHVAAELACASYYFAVLKRRYRRLWTPPDAADRRRMVRESLPVGLAKALRLVYYQGDLLLITWLATTEATGHFLASHKVVLSLAVLALVYQQNAYPTLSRLMGADAGEGLRFQERISRYALLFAVPAAVGGAVLSQPLIELLFGGEYRPAAPIFRIMIFTVPLVAVAAGLQNQLLAAGRSDRVLGSEVAGLCVHLALALWLIPAHAGTGAAVASLSGRLTVAALLGFHALRTAGGLPGSRRLLSVLAGGGAMALAMLVSDSLGPISRGLLGLAIYGGAVLGLGALRLDELRALARSLRTPA